MDESQALLQMNNNDLDLYYNETPSSDVQERDVDLLITEELSSSITFIRWYCEKIYDKHSDRLPSYIKDVDVRHSCLHIGDGYGESDIVLRIKDQLERDHVFLIENKINASFTPEQPERYRKRLKSIIRTDAFFDGRTILMAPASYLHKTASSSDFDIKISYEDLIEYFDSRSKSTDIEELAMRYAYRRDLLLNAVRKKTYSGPVINPDPRVCDFRDDYANLIRELAPELQLGTLTKVKEPNEWVNFPNALSDSCKPHRFLLIHKPYGRVALQINPKSESIESIIEIFKTLLSNETDMFLAPAKKSFSIYIDTPKLDMRKSAANQLGEIKEAVSALKRLKVWFETNTDTIRNAMRA